MIFTDRFTAAEKLAEKLQKYKNNENTIILAIPRGGVQTGYTLAKELNLQLDIILTKKISYPGNPEYAIGSVSLQSQFINKEHENVSQDYVKSEVKKIRRVLNERYKKYLGDKKIINLKDKIVIITDDGVATGSTILAAVDLVKKEDAKKVIVAIPIGPNKTIEKIKEKSDEVVCLDQPVDFMSIGEFYKHFEQVSDKEAIKLLEETNRWK